MVTKVRLLCEICGKHFYYDFYKKETYKIAEEEYINHYKQVHEIDIG